MAMFAYAVSMATGLLLHIDVVSLVHNGTLGTAASAALQATQTKSFSTHYSIIFLTELLVSIVAINMVLIFLAKSKNWLRSFYQGYMYFSMIYSTFYLGIIWFSLLNPVVGLIAGAAFCCIVLYLYIRKRYTYFNLFGMTIAIAGSVVIGANINPIVAVAILAIIALYDWWAVMKSGTMLQLVNVIMQDAKPLPFMLIDGNPLEFAKRATDTRMKCKACMFYINEIKATDKQQEFECPNCGRHTVYEKAKRGLKLLETINYGNPKAAKAPAPKGSGLGLGDIVIPSILLVSLYASGSLKLADFAFIGAVVGLYLNFVWLKRRKQAIPAIPLIAIAMLAFMGLALLV